MSRQFALRRLRHENNLSLPLGERGRGQRTSFSKQFFKEVARAAARHPETVKTALFQGRRIQ